MSAQGCDALDMDELLFPLLERLEKKDFSLPPLPHVANQLLVLTMDPKASISQLTKLIQQDPILTSTIFNIANSAACGASRQIDSVDQAVAWIGLNAVAGTAFAISFQSNTFNDGGYRDEVKGLWAHSIVTGFYAKAMATMMGHNQETGFLCGLLHGIGKPFVVHTVNEYRDPSTPRIPWSVMDNLINQSYVEVGRQLADGWNFPVPVKEAIALHQDHSFHVGTHPGKGSAITCLARYLATHHLESVTMPQEDILALSVTSVLQLSPSAIESLVKMRPLIQAQLDFMLF